MMADAAPRSMAENLNRFLSLDSLPDEIQHVGLGCGTGPYCKVKHQNRGKSGWGSRPL
jgi:hypothetical protein